MTEILIKKYEKIFRKLHKSDGHVIFLTECSKRSVLPKFTQISAETINQLRLKKPNILKYREKQLQIKLDEQLEKNLDLIYELNYTYSLLSSLIHHSNLNKTITNIKYKVRNKEIPHDLRRQKKLDFLLKNNSKNENYAEITITNFTKNNDIIPDNIKQILNLGIKNPMGGIANKTQILHKSESLFSHWLDYAQKSEINSFKIAEVRSLLTLEMQKLHKCNTPNSDCKDLKQFLNQNKHILFIEIDKSKNLALMNLDDYVHKLIR